jgi:hypothetical protein
LGILGAGRIVAMSDKKERREKKSIYPEEDP